MYYFTQTIDSRARWNSQINMTMNKNEISVNRPEQIAIEITNS